MQLENYPEKSEQAQTKDSIGEYKTFRLPKHRELLGDLERMATKHPILVLSEFDVTEARDLLQKHKVTTGETISFTAWIIRCISEAVSEDKMVQAYRKGKQLVVFEDVDVAFMMDKASQFGELVAGSIVRKANEKSVRQIHEEIRAAQAEKTIQGTLVGEGEDARLAGLFQSLPSAIRRLFGRWYSGNPKLRKKTQGTVGITSVGNILGTQTGAWGCPIVTGMYPLMFGISGISRKPGISEEKIEPREFLSMSVMLDHDAVDGAEAARFLRRLGELFTQAYGLEGDILLGSRLG